MDYIINPKIIEEKLLECNLVLEAIKFKLCRYLNLGNIKGSFFVYLMMQAIKKEEGTDVFLYPVPHFWCTHATGRICVAMKGKRLTLVINEEDIIYGEKLDGYKYFEICYTVQHCDLDKELCEECAELLEDGDYAGGDDRFFEEFYICDDCRLFYNVYSCTCGSCLDAKKYMVAKGKEVSIIDDDLCSPYHHYTPHLLYQNRIDRYLLNFYNYLNVGMFNYKYSNLVDSLDIYESNKKLHTEYYELVINFRQLG